MDHFSEELVADLPEPARRYFTHALRPGTPLTDSVRLRMHGRIRAGAWLPFHADEVITAGRGFRWQASAAGGLLRGHDVYDRGRAGQRFALFGLVPVLRAGGPEVTRSALGRAVAELCFLPSALLSRRGVQWAGTELGGVPCFESAAGLPEPVDLAVLTVPAGAVGQVARECGRRGVRSLVVVTSGVDGRELLATCHRYGMRLVGPNCFGITNTAAGFDATFSASLPQAGGAGVVVQSGGVGIALREHLSRLGIGLSTFASVGDKYDVSSNDMLLWWESDPSTRLGLLYVESFGNPRKFARTARRVGRRISLLTVISGRSEAGPRGHRVECGRRRRAGRRPPPTSPNWTSIRSSPVPTAHHEPTAPSSGPAPKGYGAGARCTSSTPCNPGTAIFGSTPGLGIGLTRHCRRTHPRPSHRPGRSAPGIHHLEARRAHSRTRDRPR